MNLRWTPLLLCSALLAQEFDVATIKPTAPGTIEKGFHFTPGGGLQTLNATLNDLVVLAYDLLPGQIQGGPPWIAVDRFDVNAKVLTESESDPQKWTELTRLRTRALLASRFHLAFHKETREFAMYELRVDKSGPKAGLVESNATGGVSFYGNVMVGKGGHTMHDLTMILPNLLQKPVVDKTGLTGGYDFTLRWSADELSLGAGKPAGDLDKSPSIFTALREQLGLRLDSVKGPLEMIVIDRAERPSDN
jgi:uncharacterized protein (TIGR03435 family)